MTWFGLLKAKNINLSDKKIRLDDTQPHLQSYTGDSSQRENIEIMILM